MTVPYIVDLYPNDAEKPIVSAVVMAEQYVRLAKSFWQHTGEGISSRRAEYCWRAFKAGTLAAQDQGQSRVVREMVSKVVQKGPRRYQKGVAADTEPANSQEPPATVADSRNKDAIHFVEERFGRNLDITLAESAKCAIRKRIAGALNADGDCGMPASVPGFQNGSSVKIRDIRDLSADDVYLYPCGMNSIFHAHQLLMAARVLAKSITYGYVRSKEYV